MKHVILIRHGKSSWNHNVGDVLRPLSERGVSDIKKIAKQFKLLEINPRVQGSMYASTLAGTNVIWYSILEGMKKNINITKPELISFIRDNKIMKVN